MMMDTAGVRHRLASDAARVEQYLAGCLDGLEEIPAGLRAAMNYSLLAGGKRLRPVLCLSIASLCGLQNDEVMPFAAGIECIHTYSLIHDDLPAMDDDDLRRGRPANHKQFDEATAILAGDGLLTDAFWLMGSLGYGKNALPAERVLRALQYFSKAAGSRGMVGGQYLDMRYTGQGALDLDSLRAMHAMKTGALLQASCVCGAILAGAGDVACAAIAEYGKALGAAFQIMDDVLDEIGDTKTLGKPVGSDVAKNKVTYPSLLGIAQSQALAAAESEKAVSALASCTDNNDAAFLRGLARYVADRIQ